MWVILCHLTTLEKSSPPLGLHHFHTLTSLPPPLRITLRIPFYTPANSCAPTTTTNRKEDEGGGHISSRIGKSKLKNQYNVDTKPGSTWRGHVETVDEKGGAGKRRWRRWSRYTREPLDTSMTRTEHGQHMELEAVRSNGTDTQTTFFNVNAVDTRGRSGIYVTVRSRHPDKANFTAITLTGRLLLLLLLRTDPRYTVMERKREKRSNNYKFNNHKGRYTMIKENMTTGRINTPIMRAKTAIKTMIIQ